MFRLFGMEAMQDGVWDRIRAVGDVNGRRHTVR